RTIPTGADARQALGRGFIRDLMSWQGEHTLAAAHQINFYQARIRMEHLALLFNILSLPLTSRFIHWAKELDDSDELASIPLANFKVALRNFLLQNLEHLGLSHRRDAIVQRH